MAAIRPNRISVDFEDELLSSRKADLDFLCEEFHCFFATRDDFLPDDRDYAVVLYEELLCLSHTIDGSLKRYLESRLKRIEHQYHRLLR